MYVVLALMFSLARSLRIPYLFRKDTFRDDIIKARKRQKAIYNHKHIWPRGPLPEGEVPASRRQAEQLTQFSRKRMYSITKGDFDRDQQLEQNVFWFHEKSLQLSMKKLSEYKFLIKHKHLQDALDWMECLNRPSARPIIQLLKRARKECVEDYNRDPARLFVQTVSPHLGKYVKRVVGAAKGYGVMRSHRNHLYICVRELSLEEVFHRYYILGKVPRALCMDMRLALSHGRVPAAKEKEWAPYLTSSSRYYHRKHLKWLDVNRQFDYYAERRKWMDQYNANMGRHSEVSLSNRDS